MKKNILFIFNLLLNLHLNFFSLILLITFLIFTSSCSSPSEPPHNDGTKKWINLSKFIGMDVKGFKIIKNELYVFGAGINGGLFKTNDGDNWIKISLPDTGNFEFGVAAITMRNDDLIVAPAQSYGKKICKINSNGTFSFFPVNIPIEISDMETIQNNIVIAPGRSFGQYSMCILKEDSILNIISDSLYTNPYVEDECYKQQGIRETASNKLIKINAQDKYVLSAEVISHFIVTLDTTGYNCFSTKGLSYEDKYTGAQDINYYKDTIFAATQFGIRYFINDKWTIYKDSLPIHNGTFQIAHSFTFFDSNIFIATTNHGVLLWNKDNWETFNDGLPFLNEKLEIYPGISYIIAFNNCLFLGFSTDKVWDYGMRGVWKFKFNN